MRPFFITLTDYISIVKIVRRFKLFAKKSLKSRLSRSQKFAKKNTDSKVSQEAAKKANQPKKALTAKAVVKKAKRYKSSWFLKVCKFSTYCCLGRGRPRKSTTVQSAKSCLLFALGLFQPSSWLWALTTRT